MRLFGYARVSTSHQSLDIQIAALKAERHRILERVNEGRLAVKVKGIRFGRKRTIDRNKIIQLHASGLSAIKIAQQAGIARATVYKILNEKIT